MPKKIRLFKAPSHESGLKATDFVKPWYHASSQLPSIDEKNFCINLYRNQLAYLCSILSLRISSGTGSEARGLYLYTTFPLQHHLTNTLLQVATLVKGVFCLDTLPSFLLGLEYEDSCHRSSSSPST